MSNSNGVPPPSAFEERKETAESAKEEHRTGLAKEHENRLDGRTSGFRVAPPSAPPPPSPPASMALRNRNRRWPVRPYEMGGSPTTRGREVCAATASTFPNPAASPSPLFLDFESLTHPTNDARDALSDDAESSSSSRSSSRSRSSSSSSSGRSVSSNNSSRFTDPTFRGRENSMTLPPPSTSSSSVPTSPLLPVPFLAHDRGGPRKGPGDEDPWNAFTQKKEGGGGRGVPTTTTTKKKTTTTTIRSPRRHGRRATPRLGERASCTLLPSSPLAPKDDDVEHAGVGKGGAKPKETSTAHDTHATTRASGGGASSEAGRPPLPPHQAPPSTPPTGPFTPYPPSSPVSDLEWMEVNDHTIPFTAAGMEERKSLPEESGDGLWTEETAKGNATGAIPRAKEGGGGGGGVPPPSRSKEDTEEEGKKKKTTTTKTGLPHDKGEATIPKKMDAAPQGKSSSGSPESVVHPTPTPTPSTPKEDDRPSSSSVRPFPSFPGSSSCSSASAAVSSSSSSDASTSSLSSLLDGYSPSLSPSTWKTITTTSSSSHHHPKPPLLRFGPLPPADTTATAFLAEAEAEEAGGPTSSSSSSSFSSSPHPTKRDTPKEVHGGEEGTEAMARAQGEKSKRKKKKNSTNPDKKKKKKPKKKEEEATEEEHTVTAEAAPDAAANATALLVGNQEEEEATSSTATKTTKVTIGTRLSPAASPPLPPSGFSSSWLPSRGPSSPAECSPDGMVSKKRTSPRRHGSDTGNAVEGKAFSLGEVGSDGMRHPSPSIRKTEGGAEDSEGGGGTGDPEKKYRYHPQHKIVSPTHHVHAAARGSRDDYPEESEEKESMTFRMFPSTSPPISSDGRGGWLMDAENMSLVDDKK